MAVGPENPTVETEITNVDNNPEFIVDESLASSGVQTVQKDFKSVIKSDTGQSIIQTPPTKVITVSPPSDSVTLGNQAKGDTTNSSTWHAKFWIRILQKALHFGWRIIGGSPNVN